jgi:hypothetical protein
VNELATRIVEITPDGVRDFSGSYDEYLARAGEDHLDAQEVLRRARESKRTARGDEPARTGGTTKAKGGKAGKGAVSAGKR